MDEGQGMLGCKEGFGCGDGERGWMDGSVVVERAFVLRKGDTLGLLIILNVSLINFFMPHYYSSKITPLFFSG